MYTYQPKEANLQ